MSMAGGDTEERTFLVHSVYFLSLFRICSSVTLSLISPLQHILFAFTFVYCVTSNQADKP